LLRRLAARKLISFDALEADLLPAGRAALAQSEEKKL
jgi:hypothetical protein